SEQCPLYPQKRTLELSHGMSALCQKQTFRRPSGMIVLGKMLKLVEHHRGTSPSQIPGSCSRSWGALSLVRCRVCARLSDTTSTSNRRLSSWFHTRHYRATGC